MRLRHVEVFHAIMQVGTIKGAASTLGTSQSRVISVLQHFELQLGWSLFERQGGKLQPTPEARRLFRDTAPVVNQINVVRRVAAAFSDRSVTTVREPRWRSAAAPRRAPRRRAPSTPRANARA